MDLVTIILAIGALLVFVFVGAKILEEIFG